MPNPLNVAPPNPPKQLAVARSLAKCLGYCCLGSRLTGRSLRTLHASQPIMPRLYDLLANQANHTINWEKATVIDRKQDRFTRWIKEAVVYISARKVIELWIEMRAVISWVTPTTVFLMRQLIVASRLGKLSRAYTSFLWWRSRNEIEMSR